MRAMCFKTKKQTVNRQGQKLLLRMERTKIGLVVEDVFVCLRHFEESFKR